MFKPPKKTGISCFEIVRRIQGVLPPKEFFVEVSFEQVSVIVVNSVGVRGPGMRNTLAQRSVSNYASVTATIIYYASAKLKLIVSVKARREA